MDIAIAPPPSLCVCVCVRGLSVRRGVLQVPEGSGELRNMVETSREIICGALTTLAARI